jgi:two-component system chemotaxis response regulator CheY
MTNKPGKTQIKKIDLIPSSITFLVLEDMEAIRNEMVKDLKEMGIEGKILEAESVQSALKICSTEKIGFIVSDWNLPDGTGLDFLKKLRTSERFKKTPFIMCTTQSEINFILDAVSNGANDYIVKPWAPDDLKNKVSQVWEAFLNKK